MTDMFTRGKRSAIMSRVKGRENQSTELALMSMLRRERIKGWRRHYAIAGKPDFAFPGHRLAVFVDGCFWHGCPRCFTLPQQNRSFWKTKVAKNKARDKSVNALLRQRGWTVLRIWEHELTSESAIKRRLARLRQ